jgi:hypothetical protein
LAPLGSDPALFYRSRAECNDFLEITVGFFGKIGKNCCALSKLSEN